MRKECYDEGTIQAFLDGELAPAKSFEVSDHVAACPTCAAALAEAEEESAVAFSALDGELNALVPTHRLWTKINDSIAEEKRQLSPWRRLSSLAAAWLANPSVMVAAGLLIVFGLFAALLSLRPASDNPQGAVNQAYPAPDAVRAPSRLPASTVAPLLDQNLVAVSSNNKVRRSSPSEIQTAVVRETGRRGDVKKSIINSVYATELRPNPDADAQRPTLAAAAYMPGEESYVKTIASLTQTVDRQKDEVLRPAAQIAFARDMAVVDDAISKMKKEVRKNPKNDSAKQVLYASYQNKIDLLNSVTERNELMASLK